MGKRLYVGNLSFNTTEMDLRDLLGESGTVTDAKLVMDRDTGRPRGFALRGDVDRRRGGDRHQQPERP